ncbi:MAG TPA: M3 family oligoendopeptidase, partial [Chitinophagales bacterium]|nr:M3 family oligoendopeptidase [Chitinophagales bacterium]
MALNTNLEVEIPQRKKRVFVAEDFDPSTWENIEPYYTNLLERELASVDDLQAWLKDWSELDAVLG